jgi:mycothiol synthase
MYCLGGVLLPVRNFTWDTLPTLLDLVERAKSGSSGGEGPWWRQTFREVLGQPGLDPEANCLLLEEGGELQGFCLIFPELPVGRTVLELETLPHLASSLSEREVLRRAVGRARELGARVVHLCLPQSSPRRELLEQEGFSRVCVYWEMVWRQEQLPPVTLPHGFSVRPFKAGDAPTLTAVQNAAFAGSWGFCPNTVEQIEYRSAMTNTSPGGILFLCHGERVAGYCWTSVAPVGGQTRGLISMVGVAPDYRRRGVGRPVLLAGMEYLRSIGVDDIGLNVDRNNTPAIGLYTSVGFQKVRELNWFEFNVRAAAPGR